jgi:capsular exopolysaccharide synthesis family protein
MYSEVELEFNKLADKPIDIMGILMKYLVYWKWFILSIFICLFLAVVYIYLALPQYKIETSILFNDDQKGGASEVTTFREMGVVSRRNNSDNEVEILKKSLIVEAVVRELGLYATYTEMKPLGILAKMGLENRIPSFLIIKSKSLYGNESPVLIKMSDNDLDNLTDNISIEVMVLPTGNYDFMVEYNDNYFHYNLSPGDTTLNFQFGKINLTTTPLIHSKEIMVNIDINRPANVAKMYLNNLSVELTSKTSSVADIEFICSNTTLGRDFLNKYIDTYNEKGIIDQVELADKTSKLIEDQLAKLSGELSTVESQVQTFKQSQGLTDIASQANLYNSQMESVRQRRMDIESQLSIVTNLNNYVQNINNHEQLIPVSSGINNQSLNNQISSYNNLVLERNRLARIASSSNQSMIDLNYELTSMLNSVKSSLQNEKTNLEIQYNDVAAVYNQNRARVSAIPQQERVYSDIMRQQNIKEELFLFLLQKKEEKYMNMATVAPSSKIIDNISVAGVVSPQKMTILLIFLILGTIFPIIVIKVKDLLRYQIVTKDELEKITSVPVLGEIPKVVRNEKLLVTERTLITENGNDSFNEMIRLLRANLMFVINGNDKKVINVLSSLSGEGKTFTSINLSMSLALIDKRVLLIDMDIRKPKLSKELGLSSKEGLTLYLSGSMAKEELIKPSGLHQNLSVITAGAIPPNPNELLAKPQLDELINDLRIDFDYIFIDTAPLGLVSDGFLLSRLADINLYIARSEYTPKKYLEDAGKYYMDGRLKRLYFILNSVNLDAAEYRYGFGKKYGYGY